MKTPTLERFIQEEYPHGHKRYIPILLEHAKLHSDKNHDYASGGDPLGNFKRVAAILALYPGLDPSHPVVVALTYALKQVDAVLWSLAKNIKAKVEGRGKRLDDIAVYAVLARILDEEKGVEQVPEVRKDDQAGF